jgi:hypothetical protein
MKPKLSSWPKCSVSVTHLAVLCGVLLSIMLGGHGQVPDQQMAKAIRNRVINNRKAQVQALLEQAQVLQLEAELLPGMEDSVLLQQYGLEVGDMDEEAVAASTTAAGSTEVDFEEMPHLKSDTEEEEEEAAATLKVADTLQMGETQDLGMEKSEQVQGVPPRTHTEIDDKLEKGQAQWEIDMHDLEEILNTAQSFQLSEANTQDFEALSKLAYEEALKEAGMDEDPKEKAMLEAAESGRFELQGGHIGNMWARLRKDNPWKMKTAQASIRTPEGQPCTVLQGSTRLPQALRPLRTLRLYCCIRQSHSRRRSRSGRIGQRKSSHTSSQKNHTANRTHRSTRRRGNTTRWDH